MFNSIHLKLSFTHLAVIILAMGLSGVLLLSSLENYFLQATEENLMAQARITAQALIPGAVTAGPSLEEPPSSNIASNVVQRRQVSNFSIQTQNLQLPEDSLTDSDLSYLNQASMQLGTQLETHILILDTQGIVLLDSTGTMQSIDSQAQPLIEQALQGEYASRVDENDSEPTMALAMPIMRENKLVGVVYLKQPLRDEMAVLRDLTSRWQLSTAAASLLAGVIGLLLSRAITRPIHGLTDAAESVAQGKFDTHVPVKSRDELGRLSDTFNNMTARLRSARQMQTNFVANVSHELRTPLTAVKGMVETLRDGAIDDIEVRDRFLKTVENETNRLIRLVNDLLILSRADSEALNLRRKTVDLNKLVQTVVDRLTPQADVHELSLCIEEPRGATHVSGDADRIAQVLLNLLDNAIKYSQPGGEIHIHIRAKSARWVQTTVSDSGIGIPADDIPRIGERFYRADKARARAHGGSGLGLAIAQALVEAHGGELWIESEEGCGTEAHFTLPVA